MGFNFFFFSSENEKLGLKAEVPLRPQGNRARREAQDRLAAKSTTGKYFRGRLLCLPSLKYSGPNFIKLLIGKQIVVLYRSRQNKHKDKHKCISP